MQVHTHIPEPHLQNVIHSIWEIEGFTAFHNETIIPKGIVEIIFNFSNSNAIECEINDTTYSLARCFINGFNRTPIRLSLPGHQHFFGIRLHALAIKKIFNVPASEFLDLPVELNLVDNTFNVLWHQMAEQDSFADRLYIFMQWIERKFADFNGQEKLMNVFLTENMHYHLSVKDVAGMLCFSPRHLSRKILEATGMNTEEILHYKKYLQAVHLVHTTNLPLTSVAYQSSFSDQSHFIRAFKQYTKMTPRQYKVHKSFQKGHLYENVR